ncbi:14852_t:CDS:2 [Funneliformis geosporum]|uniref:14852_t:CDS:1 n=1 Tax=Funneliformis geosporum TaxID=1117311 RepID=A0A9W4WTM7_9GLOM|nr:14852_t:CDS:2 [Funneliformis geosporum]
MGPTGFITGFKCSICDIGISKSSISNTDDNEIYGIIPYMAPEILQGQQYTKASDVYGFGMIMWELLTGRRPFWNRNHDEYLIIEICDGLRPPIVTNAPEGYNELMQGCWNANPYNRPTAVDIQSRIIINQTARPVLDIYLIGHINLYPTWSSNLPFLLRFSEYDCCSDNLDNRDPAQKITFYESRVGKTAEILMNRLDLDNIVSAAETVAGGVGGYNCGFSFYRKISKFSCITRR